MAGPRQAKLSDRIKEIVATMLERRVKDPRLGFVTITDVRLTGDGQHASIFYTVMGDERARADTAAALISATGLIRKEVGSQLGVRHTPSLEFFLDSVPETAREIEELLAKARESDARVAERAQGAAYAGEPDPYKVREDDEEPGDD
ncbi:30S ribosome-binding factor RbfA [Aeromicrobium sp. 636]|uniref:Ribosome-binding factor A n=1 Tax=Aeromicrobium senzhongii TaxID=2663859 RepID=A0A8I0ERC2_9ACTN|nr:MULTISPECIES: 30S ribosome-binding factor RbfA [Aeromicrobium]MBC9224760.1 30S ribosome-binding factor RbfA [Aeromicrobium senzhongii]MCQ3996873.1 30S ribosome-binding factor RbfA [Aeromicrobium sp. 636]MTB86806.1 30S ribosome-binding factor RbfA [Aeromicrobium senzhongii]QNL93353.1 30S ribosome-binding factor RbfA [Aeromicrobium senzhongii]